MSSIGIIDLQWFPSSNNQTRYIIKEIAISSLDRLCEEHYVFEPPTKSLFSSNVDVKTANWLTKFYFELPWLDGEIQYFRLFELLNFINGSFHRLYVKGVQKKLFLESYITIPVLNIEDLGCPRLNILQSKKSCLRKHQNCAVTNVDKIMSWLFLFKINEIL